MKFTITDVFNLNEEVSEPEEIEQKFQKKPRRFGKPKTDEEREETHQALYGEPAPKERGQKFQVDEQTKRMQQLIESFDIKGEVKKDIKKKEIKEDALKENTERNRKLSKHRLNEYGNDSVNQSGMAYGGGQGETVGNFNVDQSYVKKFAEVGAHHLTDSEALEVSIKRALKSGQPVNNIAFFDEVNLNRNQLGFDSKSPLDIKNSILELLQTGSIKNDNIS